MTKKINSILFTILFSLSILSCGSIKVASDYDSDADFSNYKTFAFYKSGIDKVEISDIDKKRILKSIQNTLLNKGLISVFNLLSELTVQAELVGFAAQAHKFVQNLVYSAYCFELDILNVLFLIALNYSYHYRGCEWVIS